MVVGKGRRTLWLVAFGVCAAHGTHGQCGTDMLGAPNVQGSLLHSQESTIASTKAIMELPTVVHVIHTGEPLGSGSNISDAAVQAALDCVNDRFSGMIGSGPNANIEFCLASVDPLGAATNGIDRVDGNQFSGYVAEGLKLPFAICNGPDHYTVAQNVGWPVDQYYNLYLVWGFCGASGIGGFANIPAWPLPTSDGAFIITGLFTCSQTTATHEFGHSMGLFHTFYGENGTQCPDNTDCTNGGDYVCDTPPHRSGDCGSVNPCQADQSDWPSSLYNYMSNCSSLDRFSAGQIQRMRLVISDVRPGLLSSGACGGGIGITEWPPSAGAEEELTVLPSGNGLHVSSSSGILDIAVMDMLGRTIALQHLEGLPDEAYLELPQCHGAHIVRVHLVRGFASRLVVVE